jgi:chorismate synthase
MRKLDTDLAAAMMSINAVKGVEIGEGMAAAALTGTENADEIRMGPDGRNSCRTTPAAFWAASRPGRTSWCGFSVKPTSSILTPRRTINQKGEEIDLITKGRHDPCVGIRAVPIAEAMAACVILDHLLLDRRRPAASGAVSAWPPMPG